MRIALLTIAMLLPSVAAYSMLPVASGKIPTRVMSDGEHIYVYDLFDNLISKTKIRGKDK